ncbi:Arc family DNA-binding protein [Proteus vulgaris]|uniref:Arc family DNA-binding protein n=1 Tax=Proteus vulgaris TaxID=585 RepID=UPI003DA7013B
MSKYPSQTQDKFTVRFPDGMRPALAQRAENNERSMNSEIVNILDNALNSNTDLTSYPSVETLASALVKAVEKPIKEIIDNLNFGNKQEVVKESDSGLTEFELGIIHAVVVLQELHDRPELCASILKECNLSEIDCSELDDYEKERLKIINNEYSIDLKGL